ncbi:AtpZ/AtpI family protein [Pendulispora albinea]|uniref:AtpZ/AtpI family protein n=1 Tax=Pendulispora albinea TaxID=2741071 RepID=A0ABZ2LWX0_9BACT
MNGKREENSSHVKQLGRFAVVGFEFAALIVAGFFVGRFLDHRFGTGYLTWVGLALGTFAGFRSLFVMARLEQRALEKEDRENGPPPGIDEDVSKDDAKENSDDRP